MPTKFEELRESLVAERAAWDYGSDGWDALGAAIDALDISGLREAEARAVPNTIERLSWMRGTFRCTCGFTRVGREDGWEWNVYDMFRVGKHVAGNLLEAPLEPTMQKAVAAADAAAEAAGGSNP